MLKILYDYQIFEEQKIGGISRYFYELIKQLKKDKSLTLDLPIKYSSNEYLKSSDIFIKQIQGNSNFYNDFFWGLDFKGKGTLLNIKNKLLFKDKLNANQKESIKNLKQGSFDLFHPTEYGLYYLEHLNNKPFVITVYDMIHEIFPEHLSLNSQTAINKKLVLEKATKIIAISESTKKDLINILNIDEDKINVVYLANSLTPSINQNEKFKLKNLPKKYILFVGSRASYKNFYFFIQAIASLLLKDTQLNVVCTGSKFNSNEILFFERLGIKNQMFQYFVNDNSLAYLYENALAFIFPSLYEGFGIPVLEAFACRCPAIISNTSSLPEVGGDAAVYFEPKNASSISYAIEQVIYNENIRENLIQKGLIQLGKFSWKKTADQTLKVYMEILS